MTPSQSSGVPRITLILGGARSGKSRFAETIIESVAARQAWREGAYVATAIADDPDMEARIRHHRIHRSPFWTTIEEPVALAQRLTLETRPERPILVDCLTLWLSNIMLDGRNIDHESETLLASLTQIEGPIVLVANEVGLGIVPATPLGCTFRDHAGRLNQRLAALADRVVFLIAGLPMALKGKL